MGLLDIISPLVGGVGKIIDDVQTSGEEKLKAKTKLLAIQSDLSKAALEYEATIIKEQASIVRAESASQSWLARNWRPIAMLTFITLVVLHWTGHTSDNVTEDEALAMFQLIKIGLGGYVVARTTEKILPAVVEAMKKKERI